MSGARVSGARVLASNEQDVSMAEVGQPPGDIPAVSSLWVEKVQGSGGCGLPVPERVVDDEFVSARMRIEFPNGEEGEPVVTIDREVLEAMNGLWKQCMIVKVLGRHVPIAALSRKLRELWKPAGGMNVLDLPREFFMVRFDKEDDYMAAVSGGPWRVFGSILMVQAWSPEFDPLRDEIVTTPVWVRISNLPVNFYHRAILMGIAGGLGKPVRVDMTTLKFERARFARVCVEVNLKKPLKGTVMVNGERYYVSYEGLNTICPSCGIYGHLVSACPRKASEVMAQMSVQNGASSSDGGDKTKDGFTVVKKAGRRVEPPAKPVVFAAGGSGKGQERNTAGIAQITGKGNVAISNSFSGLNADFMEEELREANKENIDINIPQESRNVEPSKERYNLRKESRVVHVESRVEVTGKKGAGPKTWKNVGPKRGPKPNMPTRGLVFGPLPEEHNRLVSGKRLKVDTNNVGRAGGVFISGGSDRLGETIISHDPGKSIMEEGEVSRHDRENTTRTQNGTAVSGGAMSGK